MTDEKGISTDQKLEALLFYKAKPLEEGEICKLLEIEPETLYKSAELLEERLVFGATKLVRANQTYELVVTPELDDLISKVQKDEVKRSIGKAGAETLAIVVYKGSVLRAEVDRVRGVNSSYILRNLQTRGLVESKKTNRGTLYTPTTELFKHLGITKRTELPNYGRIMDELEEFEEIESKEAI